MIRALTRRALRLPAPRHRPRVEREWIAVSDGVRLATTVFRPADLGMPRTPAVLVRTPFGLRRPFEPVGILASVLAGEGFHVLVQDVRGRFESEGRFVPFAHEAGDGRDALAWVREQPWCNGRVALVGFSYAAWAALAAASEAPVEALVLAGGGGDLCPVLHPGGAFSLEFGLRLALGLSGRETARVDLGRALRHRPLLEADRVALRETRWFREWLEHPTPDAYWSDRRPTLAAPVPATLLLGGLHDPFLPAVLAEHADAASGKASQASGAHRLVLGPWPHPRPPRLAREGRTQVGVAIREITEFLAFVLRGEAGPPPAPVRVYDRRGRIVERFDAWPPPSARLRRLYLRSRGASPTAPGEGRLEEESPTSHDPPDRFVYDPSDPVPSLGGSVLGVGPDGDQAPVEGRPDVLCYTGAILTRDLLVSGPVRVVLFAVSSAPDTDFTAKLVDLEPSGRARFVCEGIVRCRHRGGGPEPTWLEPDQPVRLEIDLGSTCHRFGAGHRLRLEISSSSFPRFDANPNTREAPAQAVDACCAHQTVLHQTSHASCLEFWAVAGG